MVQRTYPALVTDALGAGATDTNTNDVGGRVVKTLGQADELLVAHLLNQLVNSHGVDELVIADGGAVLEADTLVVGVDLGDLALGTEALLLLGDGLGNGNPDTTGAVAGREAEGGVGAPVAGNLAQNGVAGDELHVGGSDTLAKPLALHL